MSSQTFFALSHGALRISRGDPPFEWVGRPDGMDVLEVRLVEGEDAALVLLDAPTGWGHVSNLVRVEGDTRVSWRGQLPPSGATDCFVGFDIEEDGSVRASTWSGYRVRLSGDDGHLVDSEFTK